MTHELIVLEGVGRQFRFGDRTLDVLKAIQLTIPAGAFVAVTGPSGSGKSTLLHLLGFLDRPTVGHYWFRGREVSRVPDRELVELRRTAAGFIFQQFHLLPRLTARENVALPLVYRGLPPRERASRATTALERVGLAHRLAHRPNALSGGEQQRVAIARALVTEPSVILADEPTGNLDSQSGAEILRLLTSLHAAGHTVVVVTHDPAIAGTAERQIHLKDGQLEEDR